MAMRPIKPDDVTVIAGFSADGWVVKDRLYSQALLIAAERAWGIAARPVASLTVDVLALLADLPVKPTLLLLGTGERMERPPADFVRSARDQGMVVEFMDSHAAARTYNVLVTEGRPVAALLL
ncbi:MAG: Mth938-like domain-containing protein [Sphingomonadaceae bacterium]